MTEATGTGGTDWMEGGTEGGGGGDTGRPGSGRGGATQALRWGRGLGAAREGVVLAPTGWSACGAAGGSSAGEVALSMTHRILAALTVDMCMKGKMALPASRMTA